MALNSSSKHFWCSLRLLMNEFERGEWASSSLWKEPLLESSLHGTWAEGGVRSLSPGYQLLASERNTWLLEYQVIWGGKYKIGRIGYQRQWEQRIKGSGRHQQAWEQVTLSDTHRVSLSNMNSISGRRQKTFGKRWGSLSVRPLNPSALRFVLSKGMVPEHCTDWTNPQLRSKN